MIKDKAKVNIDYLDVAKALGIIAVVIGHSGAPRLEHFFNLYHMSMFFFISGYFYNDKYTDNPINLIKKRFVSLYKPYLIFELIYLLLHNFFFKINIYSTQFGVPDRMIAPYNMHEFIKAFLAILVFAGREPMAGVFWFFASLFFVNIGFCLISYFVNKFFTKDREIIRLSIIVALLIISNLTTKYGLNIPRFSPALTMVSVYYMGYMLKRYQSHFKFENTYIAIICFALLIMNSLYGAVAVGTNTFLSPDFMIACAILGVYLNFYISKQIIKRNFFSKTFCYIGRNTVPIMALHYISFKLIALIQIKAYSLPNYMLAKYPVLDGSRGWFILYAICGVTVPLLANYIYKKLKSSILKSSSLQEN